MAKTKYDHFMTHLRSHSVHQSDPIPEWHVTRWEFRADDISGNYCICTTEIRNIFTITNKLNGRELEVGSECVEKWNIEFVLKCIFCSSALGNKIVRVKANDMLCPTCKKEKKKEEKDKQARINKMGGWIMSWKGPWQGMTYQKVAQNTGWVEWFINRDGEMKSLKNFQEYCGLIYDFEEV
jgi:hypothetical protein